jgi:hypothetical protein
MSERQDTPRPSEDMHARIMGEQPHADTNRNRTQPAAPDQAASGDEASGRGEPGAAGLPSEEETTAAAERDQPRERYDSRRGPKARQQ